jgi:predicted DsbA family dithiol-disulfide isomerase
MLLRQPACKRLQHALARAKFTSMQHLLVYSDYVCPFCYLADAAVQRLRAEGVACAYRAYELWPSPAPLPDAHTDAAARRWSEVIEPLARELAVDIRRPLVQPRSRKAHESVAFARERGRFDDMHAAVFRAFFVQGADIGRIDVLARIGEELGLDRTELKVALDIDQYTEHVLSDERAAAAEGIVAVPTMLTERGERIVGVHSYEELCAALGAWQGAR